MLYDFVLLMNRDLARLNRARRASRRMPRFVFHALVRAIGLGIFLFAGGFRRTVAANMRTAMPELGRIGALRATGRYLRLVSLTMIEQAVDYDELNRTGMANFTVTGLEHIDRVLEEGQGCIVVAPHVGNYFYYYWVLCQRYRCQTVITGAGRDILPMYLGFHAATGCTGYDFDGEPPARLYGRLRQHLFENGVVYLLSDFHRPNFVPTELLGLPNRTPGGAVALAMAQEVPVVPLVGHRTRGSRHAVRIGPPVRLHERFRTGEEAEANREIARMMERGIREHPDQWFYWFNVHERWAAARRDEGASA